MSSTVTETATSRDGEPYVPDSRDGNGPPSSIQTPGRTLREANSAITLAVPLQDMHPSKSSSILNVSNSLRPGRRARPQLSGETLEARVVSFDKPSDPLNPKDWSVAAKFSATVIVSGFAFLSPVASSMVAPAIPQLSADLGITTDLEGALVVSIFLLAYAIGPLIIGPLSEIYGRVPVLQLSNFFFIIFNFACGFCQTPTQIIICRFFAGLGGAAPISIAGGVIGDCWHADQRGRALAIYSVAPLIGPAVGPIAGAWISQTTTWRWIFWSSSAFSILVQGLGLIFLRETYAPVILQKKAKTLRKETGDPDWHVATDPSKIAADLRLTAKIRTSIARPFIMLTTQPIVVVISLYMAYVYGITYLVLSSFAGLFTNPAYYNMPTGIAGLNYIALGLGYVTGAELTARLNDRTYRDLKRKRNSERGEPEFRVPGMAPCAVLLPIGFLFYGWTAATHQHWILPDIGAFLIAVGTVSGMQSMQAYIVDAYTRYAASAMAAAMVLRSLSGFGFPLFAPIMYENLGYGWGNTLLAGVALLLGVPAPLLLWKYGNALRAKSDFAAGGDD